MLPSESPAAVQNLREQVSNLELALLRQRSLLEQCRQRQALFENAAAERLVVIERGDRLLKERADEIDRLRRQIEELTQAIAGHAEERNRLEGAYRESSRGMAELASRERTLTREILELRNEGLLHSIVRRLSGIFS
ncbi:MAG: hypothetical protein ACKV2U_02930 [Bryobacteraceae bacterium]